MNATMEPRPTAQARVYTESGQEAVVGKGPTQGKGEFTGNFLTITFDSGATHSFVSPTCAEHLNLSVSPLEVELVVPTPSGETLVTDSGSMRCNLVLRRKTFPY